MDTKTLKRKKSAEKEHTYLHMYICTYVPMYIEPARYVHRYIPCRLKCIYPKTSDVCRYLPLLCFLLTTAPNYLFYLLVLTTYITFKKPSWDI
jgi:hypothetical protein